MFYRKIVKRIFDALLAFIALIIASPIMLIVALIIKFVDRGPIIFKQKRTGYEGKDFYIYKFRTMHVGIEFGENSPTKVGQVLRKFSLDELPQLVNILKGDMSFIGPRPWITDYSQYFNETEKRRWEVLPGLSGWAQVQGRNGLTIKQKLEADIWYVNNISLKTDIMILFKTIGVIFTKRGASISENGIQDELEELKKNCM